MTAPASGWQLDKTGFRLYDGSQNNYGAPSGAGVTVEFPSATGDAFFRGVVTASQIQGPQGGANGSGARMWMDFTAGDAQTMPGGATAGVSPYWAITDPNGVIRVEAGLLAALGVSPLQWGLRVNDANSNPIFDSLGLIAVMSQIGTNVQTTGPLTGTATPLGLTGTGGEVVLSTMTFTLARQSSIFLLALASNYVSCTGVHVTAHPVYFSVDGTDDASAYGYIPVFASAGETQRSATTTVGLVRSLAAGPHVVQLIWNSEEAASDTCFNGNNVLFAFLMGA